ncbi:hypothetical protein D3C72_1739280 [compost metagenome]
MPTSMAACRIWAKGPTVVGRSKAAWKDTRSSVRTGTLSKTTEPLPVVRWPKPDQSSITVSPGALRETKARYWWPSSATTRVGTRWA